MDIEVRSHINFDTFAGCCSILQTEHKTIAIATVQILNSVEYLKSCPLTDNISTICR